MDQGNDHRSGRKFSSNGKNDGLNAGSNAPFKQNTSKAIDAAHAGLCAFRWHDPQPHALCIARDFPQDFGLCGAGS